MSRAPRSLHIGLMSALTATIVLFALGSASIPALFHFGQSARWAGLTLVCLLSFVLAGLVRPTAPSRPFVLLVRLAVVLTGIALLSAAWSVTPRLTVERGITLLLLFLTTIALAYAVSAEPQIWPWVLLAILAGAVAVCLLGLVVLGVARERALEWPLPGSVRFQGIGQNPNTVAMLAAIGTPIAAWVIVDARRLLHRAAGVFAFLLLYGTIAASNSRGALAAAAVAILVFGLLSRRSSAGGLTAVAAAAASILIAAVVWKVLPPSSRTAATPPPVPAGLVRPGPSAAAVSASILEGRAASAGRVRPRPSAAAVSTSNLEGRAASAGGHAASASTRRAPSQSVVVEYSPGALYDEIGRPRGGGNHVRTEFGSSGRVQAWVGAFHQGNARPILGFGFGTEEQVFSDRYYTFQGSRPENSYLGMYLQLGAVGTAILLAMWLVLARAAYRVVRVSRVGAICASVVAAGLVLTVVQSYVYSVGNIATIAFWVCAFLLAATARSADESQ